jgi:predicted phage terminase large subunit-like protein
MNPAEQHVKTKLLAFAMKAHAQLHAGQQLEPLPYVHFVTWHLERIGSGKCKRLIVALPPRHAKTFLCSICLSAWLLAHAPASKILLVSYGQELADKIAYDIREILRSDWFLRLFKTRIAKGKLTDVVTTAGGGVRSVSVEGGVTGLGADFIIVDDPVQIKDSANVRQIERVNDLFDSEIRTRLNNPRKGAIVIVAHRLAEDDLPGHVQREGGWMAVRLPLIASRSRTYKPADGFEWLRKKGELLRPDAFTARDIERLRRMKHPDFETLQQQNPGARDRLRIKSEHIGDFETAEVPSDTAVVLSIDPGQKGGSSNSYSVVQAWAPHNGRYLLLDQWREQARYSDFRSEVRRFIRHRRPSAILVEATAQGPALISDIRPQDGVKIISVTPVEDKISRLRRHQKAIRAGVLLLPERAPWREEFVGELTLFPYTAFDDQVDALTQFLDWIAKNPNLPKRPPLASLGRNVGAWRPSKLIYRIATCIGVSGWRFGATTTLVGSPILSPANNRCW